MQAVGAESETRLAGARSFGLCFGLFTLALVQRSCSTKFTCGWKNNLALVLMVLVEMQDWLEDLGLLHTSAWFSGIVVLEGRSEHWRRRVLGLLWLLHCFGEGFWLLTYSCRLGSLLLSFLIFNFQIKVVLGRLRTQQRPTGSRTSMRRQRRDSAMCMSITFIISIARTVAYCDNLSLPRTRSLWFWCQLLCGLFLAFKCIFQVFICILSEVEALFKLSILALQEFQVIEQLLFSILELL